MTRKKQKICDERDKWKDGSELQPLMFCVGKTQREKRREKDRTKREEIRRGGPRRRY
jgi:hypothetical protein